MKKLLLLLFLPGCWLAQTNKLDVQNGFNVYIFETPPTNYRDLMIEIDEGNTKLFSLDKDPIVIADVTFHYLHLTFFKNKLSAIAMKTKGGSGPRFLQALKETYGQPAKPRPGKEYYEWVSPRLHLIYEADPTGKDAAISFYNKALYKK